MRSLYKQTILEKVKGHLGKNRSDKISNFTLAKQSLELRVTATRLLKDIAFISLGILSAGFGLKWFLLPNEFLDGGVIGISLLTEALYSILTYLSASKTIDFVIEGVEKYIGVTIISTHSEDIRVMIIEKMGRGVTIYD